MLYLNFAPRPDLLLPSLIEAVRPAWNDPFLPPSFVVPNPATGKWLKLRLAEKLGCVLNPQTTSLETVLWDILNPDENMVFLHKEKLQQIICALLTDELLEKENFAPLKKYLKDEGTIDPVKKVQLSSEITRLLLEYEYNRPAVWDPDLPPSGGWRVKGVEQTWLDENRLYFSERAGKNETWIRESEIWQRDLYDALFGKQGLLAADRENPKSLRYLTLPQLYRLRHEPPQSFDGPSVFIFMLSKISHFHRNMLLEISRSRDIFIYLLNPCSEFWEDVDTTRRKRGKRSWSFPENPNPPISKLESRDYNSDHLNYNSTTPDHPFLELWGRSGKENITLWCQAAQYNFDFIMPDNDFMPPSRLHELQNAILTRNSSSMPAVAPDDKSIRILAAPEPGREVETMRENLLNLISADESLRFDDVVVYLPDPVKYLPFIEKVFGACRRDEPGYIPYTVLGVDAGQSRFASAVKDLISLCGGDFTRARVFSLLRNETVMEAGNISRSELEIWENWAMRLGTFRAFDAGHRREMGDHETVASDAHTFKLGMAQMMLGPLATMPVPLGFNLNSIDEVEPSPFRDFDTSDKDMVEHYCSTIEQLAQSCRGFKKRCGKESPENLVDSFLGLVDSWISVSKAEEIYCRAQFRSTLQDLILQESICGRKSLEFDELKAHVMASLQQELPGSAQAWTGCLTFAPLRSGLILPHKVVFVLGMDSDSFPGINNKSLFNLLSGSRIAGDPDPVSDNRYIFLELICAAGESLIISYVGQDIQKDRIIQPSSVVIELASAACLYLPDPEKGPEDPGVIPLVSHDLTKGYDTEASCWDPSVSRLAELSKIHSDGNHRKYRLDNSLEPRAKDEPVAPSKLRTSVGDIAGFLKNPLEYHLKRSLGLRDELIDETSTATDEPLESDYFSLYSLKRQLLSHLLHLAFPPVGEPCSDTDILADKAAGIARQLFAEICSSGLASEGAFARKDLISLQEWAASAAASVGYIADKYKGYKLYTDTDHNLRDDKALSDFVFTHDGREFRISVQIPLVLRQALPGKQIVIIKLGADLGDLIRNIDLWLYSFIFALNGSENIANVLINKDDASIDTVDWTMPQPWDAAGSAKAWIAEIIREMLERRSCEHAPAVWFQKTLEEIMKSGSFETGSFLKRLRERAEDESDWDSDYRLYYPSTDAFKLTEARFPESDDTVMRVFSRLCPVLTGKFSIQETSDKESDLSAQVLEGSFNG
jgi:exonuclease V gamma subunit